MSETNIVEGVHGTFYYHLRQGGHRALCGDKVMHTSIPLSAWGTVTHIKERWCSKCKEIYDAQKDGRAQG